MIGAILFAAAAAILALELLSLGPAARRVRVDYETDLRLAEPDEVVTLRYTVRNLSPLPKLFLGLSFYLGEQAALRESPEWIARYGDKNAAGVSFHRSFAMPPHSKVSGKVRFSYSKRGIQPLGKLYLEAGDFLGLRSRVISREPEQSLVVTARLREQAPQLRTLGGLLGEISVRRFIHEDPALVAGYREYTGREPMKRISWTATARTGQLTVKDPDFTVDANVAVVVNMQDPRRRYMETCLELVRTVCEALEERKIPYALLSNGDLAGLPEGLGKSHIFAILRRIGVSRLSAYESFRALAEAVLRDRRDNRSCIVITPEPESEAVLALLRQHSDARVCVLYGNGGEDL